MLNMLKIVLIFIVIFYFQMKKMKINECKKLVCDINGKKKTMFSDKSSKISIKSWINTKKSTQSNSV